ncbi:hypothetical protein H6P81_007163 [Aristolochia fimbriata]|uniref:Allyl alcohol dehydrogenase n=1 Tax=Aristolochia fimbriata TaxID=158543 RepID=A0AAV7F048_ARIFI|nr:hypothetical protein H6P81_007163 [Aristolochia fimbriata]
MGLLSWWRKKESPEAKGKQTAAAKTAPGNSVSEREVPGMNGAEEVRRPAEATVFEFGSSSGVTIAGYCPVSDDLEPCRWEIMPSAAADAPQFRVVF